MQTDADIRAGQVRVALDFLEAEMTLTLLKNRVEELEEMERLHTEERGYSCACSSQIIASYIRTANTLVRARQESCLDCVGELCGRHMTL